MNTSKEYKQIIKGNDRKFYGGATITLADNTVLTLDNSNIIDLKIEDATSQSGKFTVGSAIINKLTLTIDNLTDEFSNYDFTDAVIRPTVGLQLSETIETLQKGVFTADDPKAIGSIITLTALDNMSKFDRDFKDVVISFPTTAYFLLSAVCLHCAVSLATSTFLNDDFTIAERPLDDALNCREIVSWIAQLSGTFARINTSRALELKWYDFEVFEGTILDGGTFDSATPYATGDTADGGNFTDYASGDSADGGSFTDLDRFHHFYSLSQLNIATDDVVITGITVYDTAEIPTNVLFGTSDYIIALEGNKLIQTPTDAQLIANTVGAKIVGMRFRPCSITTQSDPSVEGGDVAYVSDRKGNSYQILVTNLTYAIGKTMPIKCDAESPSRNSSTRYTAETKTIVEARKYTEKKLTAYDLAVQQMTSLIVHAFGLYKTSETLTDGSTIFYSHDKPTMAESSFAYQENSNGFFFSNDGGVTWNSGWDADGNAIFNVLSAIGINAEWIKVLTSFTVGENFSVDVNGNLIANNAHIQGEIDAISGKIGGNEITENGFKKTYTVPVGSGAEEYTVNLMFTDNGFSLYTENFDNSTNGGINVFHGTDGIPEMNIYVRDANGTLDDKIFINMQPILQNYNALNTAFTKLQNWAITHMGYDPLA